MKDNSVRQWNTADKWDVCCFHVFYGGHVTYVHIINIKFMPLSNSNMPMHCIQWKWIILKVFQSLCI